MKISSKNFKQTSEKKSKLKMKENRVFARLIGCELNKSEEKKVSGAKGISLPEDSIKYVCYETYIGSGLYLPDCTFA